MYMYTKYFCGHMQKRMTRHDDDLMETAMRTPI